MRKDELTEIRQRERDRFCFMVNRDGPSSALIFVRKTLGIYQTALRYRSDDPSKPKYHFARTKEYLPEFVGSVLELKSILRENQEMILEEVK